MMSVFEFTLFDAVHVQPDEIGNLSLPPVVNVVGSLVRKLPFAAVPKSFENTDAVKPEGSGFFAPDESNKLSQSSVCTLPPMFVVVDATTSPSSWNDSSCTALAGRPKLTAPTNNTTAATRYRTRPFIVPPVALTST